MNDWYHYDNEIEDKDWQDRAERDLEDEQFIRRDEKRPQFDGEDGVGSDNAGGGGVPDGDIFDRVHGQLAEVKG